MKQVLAAIVMFAALAGCATGERTGFAKTDQLEPVNRFFLNGNMRIDRNVLRPVAQTYGFVTPELFKHMIGNGLSHLELVPSFANFVLQADADRSLDVLGRFTLNTIVGMGGLLDPATEFGVPREKTDFGLTLASYGVPEGSYLVLPIIGPTTVRDLAGFAVDRAFQPTTYLGNAISADAISPALTGLSIVDARDRNAEVVDELFYRSDDPYITLRAAFLQRRRSQAAGDEGREDTLPDIFDDEATN